MEVGELWFGSNVSAEGGAERLAESGPADVPFCTLCSFRNLGVVLFDQRE